MIQLPVRFDPESKHIFGADGSSISFLLRTTHDPDWARTGADGEFIAECINQHHRLRADNLLLITNLTAAVHALRSYQHGNASPELAESIADKIEEAIGTVTPIEVIDKKFVGREFLWAAFRYFLGRMTISSACFPDVVRKHFLAEMPEQERLSWAREIREHKRRHGRIGMGEDEAIWLAFAQELEDRTEKICRSCGAAMNRSQALESTSVGSPDDIGGDIVTVSIGGPGRLIDCWKCSACGWSVTA